MVVPFVKRVASAWWFYAIGALLTAVLLTPVVSSWGVPLSLSGLAAVGVMSLLVSPYYNLWVYTRTNDWSYARTMFPSFYAAAAGVSAAAVLLLAGQALPWGIDVSAAIVALAAVLMWGAMRRVRESVGDRVLRLSDPEDAAELVFWCEEQLEADDLSPRRRAALRLSLAGGLITGAARPGFSHLLAAAFEVLEEALDEADPRDLLAIALQIVETNDVKLERASDTVGREDALALLMEAARRASAADSGALAKALTASGRSRLRESEHTRADGDGAAADALRKLAVRELRGAVEAAPRHSDERAFATLALLEAEGPRPLEGTIDDAIRRCRAALRRLWLVGAQERTAGYLVLADLLELRTRVGPSGERRRGFSASRDLALALRLCLKLAKGEHEREARRRIPYLQRQLTAGRLPSRGGRLQGWIFRRLVAGERIVAPMGAIDTAEAWAAWAMERDDAVQAAEAWQAWVTAVVADLRRRVLRSRHERLPEIQRRVVVAAHWMIRAGRRRDAVLALESARAVLLSDLLYRRRLGLAERLRAAGQTELSEDWRLMDEVLDAQHRASAGEAPDGRLTPYASDEFVALIELERLLDTVSDLPGFDDVDPMPAYADVAAAAADGPLVYLATGEETGFALVVRDGRSDPAAVELPLLTRAAVRERAEALGGLTAVFEIAELLHTLLPWLWGNALAPLVHLLGPRPSGITLVTGGALAELPLHAAFCAPGADGVWRERLPGLVVRYAPNARMLRSAQETAAARGGEPARVLSVAVPDVPGEPLLALAERESAALARLFGDRLLRPRPATVAAVSPMLDSCDVWHFACHGEHVPDAPLDSSGLLLEDGRLTLGAILARPQARPRLAVLSACQTAKIGDHAPDELIGFPSALLQAGVAGVVSCMGPVEDDAAMLLVLRFARLIAGGVPPARALAEAQAWLREATNRELHAAYPAEHAREDAPGWDDDRGYAAPATWALFSYTGA